jgi:hypothetical protein
MVPGMAMMASESGEFGTPPDQLAIVFQPPVPPVQVVAIVIVLFAMQQWFRLCHHGVINSNKISVLVLEKGDTTVDLRLAVFFATSHCR